MLAIKQYMAKWFLTSSFDIHYEIQTGGANLNRYFWFIPHHCWSNVADEFCSIFYQYTLLHFDFLKTSLYDGVFSHSQLIILLKKYDGLGLFCFDKFVGLKRTTCILGAHGPTFWGPSIFFYKVDRNLTKIVFHCHNYCPKKQERRFLSN